MFASLYSLLSRHRRLLHWGTAVAIVLSIVAFSRVRMREDIRAMLPDGQSEAATGFRLLEQTPAARKFLVNLHRGPDTPPEVLLATANRLAAAMGSPWFTRATAGIPPESGEAFLAWLVHALPSIATDGDLQKVASRLNADDIRRQLDEDYARLLSPEGWAMKRLIQVDPLDFRAISLERMRYINLMPNLRLQDGHFISADGQDALILADATVAVTDSGRTTELLAHFQRLVREIVPPGIEVSFISGHRYTAANADAIKHDLVVVLTVSSLVLLAIYLTCLRSWRALYVFLMPAAVLCLAGLAVSVFYGTVSAITIGFGAVLLGIADDYGIHVFFSLRDDKKDPVTIMRDVSLPILFAGATILGAFGVLLFSDLPGQRQLAVFSVVGIGMTLAVSLLLLPHLLLPTTGAPVAPEPVSRARRAPPPRGLVLGVWLAVLVFFGWQCTQLTFNGDFRAMTRVPPEIVTAEKTIESTWGNLRNHAILFSPGPDLASALALNDRVFEFWRDQLPAGGLVSLAPLLPGPAVAAANRERWVEFWRDEARCGVGDLVQKEGIRLGFATRAFAPFSALVSTAPAPTSVEDLRQAGLGAWLDSLIVEADGQVMVLTMVPDTPATMDIFARNAALMPGVRLVSPSSISRTLRQSVGADFVRLTGLAAAVVLGLLLLFFRDLKKVAVSLVPVVTSLLVAIGALAMFHVELTVFNVIAAVLVIGLGVDGGVFMVCKIAGGHDHDTERAMRVSSLTTMAGFGGLILARHPALHSIGITVLLGISTELFAVLWVIPALYRPADAPSLAEPLPAQAP